MQPVALVHRIVFDSSPVICARFLFRLRTSLFHVPQCLLFVVYKTALLVPNSVCPLLKLSLIRYT